MDEETLDVERAPPVISMPMSRTRRPPLPPLSELSERHPGLTRAMAEMLEESASVCLSRHHSSPTDLHLDSPDFQSVRQLTWPSLTARVARTYANRDDATRDAAYGICIAAVESELGLVTIHRAETKSGSDYYVAAESDCPDEEDTEIDLERAYRLEVSGTDAGSAGDVRYRVRTKVAQLRAGDSDLPGIAAVVGFKIRQVVLQPVDD